MTTLATPTDGASAPLAFLQHSDWQTILANSITDPVELCRLLGLSQTIATAAGQAARQFALLVPPTYLARIQPGDPRDPLLLQVLPRHEELEDVPQFSADPLGEAAANQFPGLLTKYQNRTLMVTTGACPVHCRFCFRRHFHYDRLPDFATRREVLIAALSADPSLHEVILSGGDPLSLKDDLLADLVDRLAMVPHLRRLRIHTRFPVLIPQRVTSDLLGILRSTRLAPIVVIHVNHPAEIDDMVARAVGAMVDAGVPLLSQSVLLGGVNDHADVLADLCERLVDLRVMPYYLHQLDRVAGAAHFEVPEEKGRALIEQLRERLPGYAVPRYVRETPGHSSKVPLV